MICRDKKNDRYIIQVYSKGPDGKPKRKCATEHSLSDAKKTEARMYADAKKGVTGVDALTLPILWAEYKAYCKPRVKRTTYETYERLYDYHLEPFFKDERLNGLSSSFFQEWKDSLPENFTLASKHHVYTVLHMILRYGFRTHGCLALQSLEMVGDFKESPDTALMNKSDELHYWTPVQFEMFSQSMKSFAMAVPEESPDFMVRWSSYVLYSVLFYAGLRRGEANALYVSDFHDGEQPYLDISKSVTHKVKGGGWFLTGPKNRASIRKVPIPKKLVAILHEHMDRLRRIPLAKNQRFEKMYLIGGVEPLNDSSSDRIKEDVERRLCLPHIRVHDLRHSYVSVLINAGTPITTISKLVGHASTEMTWKVYSHMYPVTLSNAIDVFDNEVPKMPVKSAFPEIKK